MWSMWNAPSDRDYYDQYGPNDEPEPPSCECGAIGDETCEPTCERITPDRDDLNELAMAYALDMVYASLAADGATRDADWERERDHYAEDLALENRHPRREVA